MKDKLLVVKIGGNIIDDSRELEDFLNAFSKKEGKKILIHGGGKIATEISQRLGIESKFVEGRRVTTSEDLEVVTMVYGGLLSKKICAKLNALGCSTLGLSGADASILESEKRPVLSTDYGLVGDVKHVNEAALINLLEQDFTLTFCALTADKNGQILNTNADTIAAEIAKALAANYEVELLYIFEKRGVLQTLDDENSVIPFINETSFNQLKEDGVIHQGMLPKLENALSAVKNAVKSVKISDPAYFINVHQFCTQIIPEENA